MGKQIRSIEVTDAQAVCDIYAPFVSDSATSFEAIAPDTSEMERRIGEITPKHPWLVFEGDSSVLGYAYACTHRTRHAYQWSADVSVYIHEGARNRRVGQALYTALFHLLRRQGYFNAYAGITLPNPASVRLHESLGFSRIGVYTRTGFKFGKWHDVLWLQLRLSEESGSPHDPRSTEGLFQDERILAFLHKCAKSVKFD